MQNRSSYLFSVSLSTRIYFVVVDFLAPNGCHTVAVMYKKGDGVTQDERKFKYYRDLTLEIVKATGATVGTKTSTVSGM